MKIKPLSIELEESEDARRQLKRDLESLTIKMTLLEEDLFESKKMQLELLDNIKYLEE